MTSFCPMVPATETFGSDLLRYIDCQTVTLGSEGYRALAAPGSTGAIVVDALLTILVALIGYRMLLGETTSVRDGLLTLVKIGIVLALATKWPAYQVLVYDAVLKGPAELSAQVGAASDLPGGGSELASQLDAVDGELEKLGSPKPAISAQGGSVAAGAPLTPVQGPATTSTFAIAAARTSLLVGTVGSLAIVRIGAGILSALGALFVAALLFAGTRGLFDGWLRGLLATIVGGTAISLAVQVEVSLLHSWLFRLLARAEAGLDDTGAPTQLLATILVFDAVLLGLLVLAAYVCLSLRTASAVRGAGELIGWAVPATARTEYAQLRSPLSPSVERSRAAAIADNVQATERRERSNASTAAADAAAAFRVSRSISGDVGLAASGLAQPSGGGRRRTTGRVSAGAGRRDRIS